MTVLILTVTVYSCPKFVLRKNELSAALILRSHSQKTKQQVAHSIVYKKEINKTNLWRKETEPSSNNASPEPSQMLSTPTRDKNYKPRERFDCKDFAVAVGR